MRKLLMMFIFVLFGLTFAQERLDSTSIINSNHKYIEYDDVILKGSYQYKPKQIVTENGIVMAFYNNTNTIIKTNECIILSNDVCTLYFYGISFDDVFNWNAYTSAPRKIYKCKKVIVELKD